MITPPPKRILGSPMDVRLHLADIFATSLALPGSAPPHPCGWCAPSPHSRAAATSETWFVLSHGAWNSAWKT